VIVEIHQKNAAIMLNLLDVTTFVNAILIFWLFYKFRILAAAIILYKPVKTAPTTTLMFEYVPAKRLCYPECVIVEIHQKNAAIMLNLLDVI
jgi:hypothetical protein